MKTVWKFPIKIEDRQAIMMPRFTIPLHVGLDPKGVPCIWAQVSETETQWERDVLVTGTGQPLPNDANIHCGSFVQGDFVWHVWLA